MSTDRDDLESWSKGDLIARAESLGIEGAAKYTKVELIDEIRRALGAADRGFLGKARDVLRGVVEKGLARALGTEVPASVASGVSGSAPAVGQGPASATHEEPAEGALASRTLAEIHLAQGDRRRARVILEAVVRAHPEDSDAAAMLAALADVTASGAEPSAQSDGAGSSSETAAEPAPTSVPAEVDLEALAATVARPVAPSAEPVAPEPNVPARYDVDECVAMPVDSRTLYVYWEARPATIARARRVLGATAQPTLRVLVVEPSTHGPRVQTRDQAIEDGNLAAGESFVRDLPPGAILRAAVGFALGERFLPIAHTADVESPPEAPSPVAAHETGTWTPPGEPAPVATEATDAGGAPTRASLPRPLPTSQPDFSRAEAFAPSDDAPPVPEELADIPEEILGRGLSSAELSELRRRVRMGAGAPPPHLAGFGPGEAGAGKGAGASEQWAQGAGGPSSTSWGGARP
jgi:hypothetical protein